MHLELFPEIPANWRDDALAEKWRKVRTVRRVVTGALEVERANKRIGSSLEAAPIVYVSDRDLFAALVEIDLAEVSHHLGGDADRRRGAGGGVPPRRREGRRGGAEARRRPQVRALVENLVGCRLRSRLSRRDAARRAGAARMGRDASCEKRESGGVTWRQYLYGPLTRFGLIVAAIACALDQAAKLWLLFVLRPRQPRHRPPHAVSRLRAHLEYRHQLRPVSAGQRFRPLRPAGAEDRRGGGPVGLARAGGDRN